METIDADLNDCGNQAIRSINKGIPDYGAGTHMDEIIDIVYKPQANTQFNACGFVQVIYFYSSS